MPDWHVHFIFLFKFIRYGEPPCSHRTNRTGNNLVANTFWEENMGICVYRDAFTVIFPFLSISQISFSLSVGSFDLNLFTLALLIAHLVLNFGDEPNQLPTTPEGGWTKVNWLKHEHQDKTDKEIESMLTEELAGELRQALEELLASREKQ